MLSTADERVYMTSAAEYCEGTLGAKIDEKVFSDDAGGMDVVTDIGLWIEKKEATCISGMQLVGIQVWSDP